MDSPLVSCVMPTWNRRAFIPCAIDCFLKQTYENRELVILDDGEEPIQDLIPRDGRIRYVFESHRRVTGDKRNRVNELAKGAIICHWDDDDWSAADRIAFQVDLLEKSNKPVTGFGTLLFWDVDARKTKRYRTSMAGYVCGTTLAYRKNFWALRHFRLKQEASDNDFVNSIARSIAASDEFSHIVARIHNCHHTSKKGGIREVVADSMIPAAFWENEKLRLA